MNKSESVIKKTETAIDDFHDLWKRRKLTCILALIIIIAPIVISVFIIPNLQSKLRSAEQERDKAQLQLAPFLAVANKNFPESSPEKRLELLSSKMDEMIGTFKNSNKEVLLQLTEIKQSVNSIQAPSSRVLSKNAEQLLTEHLKTIQSFEIEILSIIGDNEAFELASQIKNIFNNAGWSVKGVNLGIFGKPVKNLILQFGETPPQNLQKALLPLFDDLGYHRAAEINNKLASNKIKIIIGSK